MKVRRHWGRYLLGTAGMLVVAMGLVACSDSAQYDVTVKRVDGGIPYIIADDYGSLGYGTGYAMAQDVPCLLAQMFVTYGAQRARYLGNSKPNRVSDFFYQLFVQRGIAKQKLESQWSALFKGAAAGYNRYLSQISEDELPKACRGADWVQPISAIDFRRKSRMSFLLPFIKDMIVSAQPPEQGRQAINKPGEQQAGLSKQQLHAIKMAKRRAGSPDRSFGSNAVAVGSKGSTSYHSMLLANPHQPWHGLARFYAFAQVIPEKFFVVGANKVGRVQVGFGATRDVAWTGTVSTAPRMTFYRLKLVPGHPTQYLFDGQPRKMQRTTVHIKVRGDDGELHTRSHTFYRTQFGAYLVGGAFPWNQKYAYAVRVPKYGWRGINALDEVYQADNVHEFAAIQNQYQYQPTNVIAAGDEGQVLYADLGPVPYLTPEQVAECKVRGGMDGSRSECMWRSAEDAAAPGIMPPEKLPHQIRSDYVANMNDSYWLTNAKAPLTEFSARLGSKKTQRTLRTRSGLYQIRQQLQHGKGFTLPELKGLVMNDLAYTGLILRDDLVTLCRNHPEVTLSAGDQGESISVDLSKACSVLAHWDLHANLDSRGAALFREFMMIGTTSGAPRDYGNAILPASWDYRVPFDPQHAVGTPRGLNTKHNPDVLKDLAKAVKRLRDAGVALDTPLGKLQYVTRNGDRIPIHGGSDPTGVLNIIAAPFIAEKGAYPRVTGSSSSWIQATAFTRNGPISWGVMTYSQSPNPASPHYADMTRMFSNKQWVRLPFDLEALDAAAVSTTHLVE